METRPKYVWIDKEGEVHQSFARPKSWKDYERSYLVPPSVWKSDKSGSSDFKIREYVMERQPIKKLKPRIFKGRRGF